tara:strand:- start:1083 stop:1229 length:147 start_codon:yes stop_codon:yes gene_type:complete
MFPSRVNQSKPEEGVEEDEGLARDSLQRKILWLAVSSLRKLVADSILI